MQSHRPRRLARLRRVVLAAFAPVAFVAVLIACGRRSAAPVVAEPVAAVPSDVAFYTHVLYGGEDAYLVEGRWYRPGAEGWVVFSSEPLELELIRRSLENDEKSALLSFFTSR